MNPIVERLIIEAGWSDPKSDPRTQRLVFLVVQECNNISKQTEEKNRFTFMGEDVPPVYIRGAINLAFK